MVQIFKIPWAAWYGDEDLDLEFPDTWEVKLFKMKDAPEISKEEIETSINNPVRSPTLKEIAQGKQNAVIVVEDISRPTSMEIILNVVLTQLNTVGIQDENITIIYALGSHRPLDRRDSIKKLGLDIVDRINIENHHPYENLIYLGESQMGTPIYVNQTYYDADLKIAIGSVVPHPLAGYGGGAKIILPGVSGIETLHANHVLAVKGSSGGIGFVTELRKDIENVCKKVGLDFSINIVSTMRRGIAGIFAGHFIEAHRKAMELAKEVYSTEMPTNLDLDIGFFNLYPEDTELFQAIKGFNFIFSSKTFLRRYSAIIFLTAASEGRGFHSLQGETGAKLYQNWGDSIIFKGFMKKKNFGIFSPNI
ncbi:MAG: nickel-dependent lactate racemase, partial [Candidatus Lokiarchaeota archaeon]|nr:nickel-dependent lactate racemase [Candidatus Lokiarchaeota archaeon]